MDIADKMDSVVNASEDVETLELEEDGSINATIKDHSLVGKEKAYPAQIGSKPAAMDLTKPEGVTMIVKMVEDRVKIIGINGQVDNSLDDVVDNLNPGFSGIAEGGFFHWNKELPNKDKHLASSSKGKDVRCVVEIKESTAKDFGDFVADSFHEMELSFNRKRKQLRNLKCPFLKPKNMR
ncbi:hypothetical protein V6N12_065112 [Hibiscus sabdariffa]|uniref:Uncharacterized protein n=1 Tax=Hibiscus sabdariffa TaxID=183260 RepID=A0ABR2G8S1_9ROSI